MMDVRNMKSEKSILKTVRKIVTWKKEVISNIDDEFPDFYK